MSCDDSSGTAQAACKAPAVADGEGWHDASERGPDSRGPPGRRSALESCRDTRRSAGRTGVDRGGVTDCFIMCGRGPWRSLSRTRVAAELLPSGKLRAKPASSDRRHTSRFDEAPKHSGAEHALGRTRCERAAFGARYPEEGIPAARPSGVVSLSIAPRVVRPLTFLRRRRTSPSFSESVSLTSSSHDSDPRPARIRTRPR